MRLVVRGGRLLDGAGDHGVHDLYVKDGAVEGLDLGGAVDAEVDAEGRLVTPAFLDLHVHLRDPGQEVKEDLASGLAAAAAGGFGTVVSMANTSPVVDDPGIVATRWRHEPLQVAVAADAKLGAKRRASVAELSRQAWLLRLPLRQ